VSFMGASRTAGGAVREGRKVASFEDAPFRHQTTIRRFDDGGDVGAY
jgi:hypothetical protein